MPKYSHLTDTAQLDREWTEKEVFPLCDELRKISGSSRELAGRALYCLFYEPSFLTRTSFERAIGLLGGQAYHTEDASQFFPVTTANFIDNVIGLLASLHVDVVVVRSSDVGVIERAEAADAMPVINGGSLDDHPTQALADLYTIHRELGQIDGVHIAVIGRLEHRNVSALLKGLSMFDDVNVTLIPISGNIDPRVASLCEERKLRLTTEKGLDAVEGADAIYLNAPRTVAHAQLLQARDRVNLHIDEEFMSRLKPNCVILDPMQRSGDFSVDVKDDRLAFYRQSENALITRMAILHQMLAG